MRSKSTVIIPNYNGIKFLRSCLETLRKDSALVPVIVVDNASTDGSEKIWQEFPGVKQIRNEKNLGFAAAVNQGILAADTEYVILLNNDIEVKTGFISTLEACLDGNDTTFSAQAQMRDLYHKEHLDGAGDYYCALGWAFAAGKGKKWDYRGNREKRIFSACAGAAIYRRERLISLGLFDEAHFAYFEDVDLGYRARIHGYVNRYVPEAVVYHAGSGASGSRHNAFKVNLSSANSIYLIGKNMPLLQVLLNLPFLVAGIVIKLLFFMIKGLGGVYLKGLGKGFQKLFSPEGRKRKVPFRVRYLGNYCRIQLELWGNLLRLLLG